MLAISLYVDIFRYKEKILKASKLSEPELLELMLGVLNRINFISEIHFGTLVWDEAKVLCEEIDLKDVPHVALCLFLGAELWSGGEKLKRHLLSKGFTSIFEY